MLALMHKHAFALPSGVSNTSKGRTSILQVIPNRGNGMHTRVAAVIRLSLFLAFVSAHPVATMASPLEIGIIPTLSTRTILKTYQPLREYLEAKLQQPVALVTAPDYRSFIDRTQSHAYPLVITASHFARLAQHDAGYVPMVRIQRELQGVVVVRNDSPIRQIEDLRNRTIATPEDIAVVSMLGRQLMREHGLEPGKDITVQTMPSFNTAMLAVHNGDVAAALTAPTAINQMPDPVRTNLRIISRTRIVPHNIVLASPQVPRADIDKITRLLIEFKDDQQYGTPFFKRTGFRAFTRPTEQELRSLDPYVNELRKMRAPR